MLLLLLLSTESARLRVSGWGGDGGEGELLAERKVALCPLPGSARCPMVRTDPHSQALAPKSLYQKSSDDERFCDDGASLLALGIRNSDWQRGKRKQEGSCHHCTVGK